MPREKVTIRRAPRIWSFIVTGAVAGFVVALVITAWLPNDPSVGFWPTLGFFSVFGVGIGGIAGGGVSLIADARSRSRKTSAVASIETSNGSTQSARSR